LLKANINVGIVTAAGYNEPEKYYGRLYGLLNAVDVGPLTDTQKSKLVVLGGEANYLFRFDGNEKSKLRWIPRSEWLLDEMKAWTDNDIKTLLDLAEETLRETIRTLRLAADILRKDRAVGMIPQVAGTRFGREQLEETVFVVQKRLELSEVGRRLPFCAFNGGNDIFVDIGDKAWGVLACQKFLGGIESKHSLHVGDQFLSAGANDFKARNACTTAWITSPTETVELLDELMQYGVAVERVEGIRSG
jgi:IMP and pyridine-specific 5'-nucleotidase